MNLSRLKSWLNDTLSPSLRLRKVCVWYLIYLMISTRKHTLRGASEFSGINKSQFSRFLNNHAAMAAYALQDLSKKQARRFSAALDCLAKAAVP